QMLRPGPSPADPQAIDWDKHGFAPVDTAFVAGSVAPADGSFEPLEVLPWGELALPPSATVLNYGQALFEGLKARRGVDGKVRLFRVADNAERMRSGAERFMLAQPPAALFRAAVEAVVTANLAYLPPYGKGALYIRPILVGAGRTLAPLPSPRTLFMVYANPVGHYFKGLSCIAIKATDEHHRAAEKGVGRVKAAGNYAPCFKPVIEAKAGGYADLLFLDHDGKRIEEVGSANLCAVKKGALLVADSPSILQGITRDSVKRIAADKLGLRIEFGPLALDRVLGLGEWKAEGQAEELFCTGTAAIVSPIGRLTWRGKDYEFSGGQPGKATSAIYAELDGIQTGALPDPYGWTSVVA
ncbi:MAG: branched-chain-amino-acid transaminase, partial [Spirochaetaceae bacterium]|nr:branched-chain-amino-acid transaminase [Spirochaetaceae bacterium]